MWLLASIAAHACPHIDPAPPDEQLGRSSPVVFEGAVIARWSAWSDTEGVVTLSRMRVARVWKGRIRTGEVLVRTAGGADPELDPGFLYPPSCGDVYFDVSDDLLVFADVIDGATVDPMRVFEGSDPSRDAALRMARRLHGGRSIVGWDIATDPPPPPRVAPGYLAVDARIADLSVDVEVLATSPALHRRDGTRTVVVPPGTWTATVDRAGTTLTLDPVTIASGETVTRRVDLPGGVLRVETVVRGADEPIPWDVDVRRDVPHYRRGWRTNGEPIPLDPGVYVVLDALKSAPLPAFVAQTVTVTDGADVTVRIALDVGRVVLDGSPGAAALYRDDRFAWRGTTGAASAWLVTGPYTATCGQRVRVPVEIHPGETVHVACP